MFCDRGGPAKRPNNWTTQTQLASCFAGAGGENTVPQKTSEFARQVSNERGKKGRREELWTYDAIENVCLGIDLDQCSLGLCDPILMYIEKTLGEIMKCLYVILRNLLFIAVHKLSIKQILFKVKSIGQLRVVVLFVANSSDNHA